MSGRGMYKRIFVNIINSFQKAAPVKPVGEDNFGNQYFEQMPREGSESRHKRWFQPLNEENFDQPVPVEWEAWLRFRRVEPPSPEEIEINRLQQAQTLANAKKLEQKNNNITNTLELATGFPELPYPRKPDAGFIRVQEPPKVKKS